jgi:hypothetical protein
MYVLILFMMLATNTTSTPTPYSEATLRPFSATDIRHCVHTDGSLLFSDLPCPPGTRPIPWQTGEPSTFEFARARAPALAPTEKPRRPSRTKTARRQIPHETKAKCQSAIDALKDLRAHRRAGYRIDQESALDRDEARHKLHKREFC